MPRKLKQVADIQCNAFLRPNRNCAKFSGGLHEGKLVHFCILTGIILNILQLHIKGN